MFSVMDGVAEQLVSCAVVGAIGVEFEVVQWWFLRRTIKANYKAIKKVSQKPNYRPGWAER